MGKLMQKGRELAREQRKIWRELAELKHELITTLIVVR